MIEAKKKTEKNIKRPFASQFTDFVYIRVF